MFARRLTWCSLEILVIATVCVAQAAWTEFEWSVGSLIVGFPTAIMALQLLDLGLLALLARRQWLAALAVLPASVLVSATAVHCCVVARPSGPDAYETLVILRSLGAMAMMPVVLVVILAVLWLVPAPVKDTKGEEKSN